LQGSGDPAAGEAWMLKMSEWAPQSLGGSMAAGEALDPKGDEGEPLTVTRTFTPRKWLRNDRYLSSVSGLRDCYSTHCQPAGRGSRAVLPYMCFSASSCVPAGNFSRIIVYDRASHRLVEEQISATLVLAMRNMYQSKVRTTLEAWRFRNVVWLDYARHEPLLNVVIGRNLASS
jgi:hypothetical protein